MSLTKHILVTIVVTAITIAVVAFLSELVGVWGYIFQPYTKFKGGSTVE